MLDFFPVAILNDTSIGLITRTDIFLYDFPICPTVNNCLTTCYLLRLNDDNINDLTFIGMRSLRLCLNLVSILTK